MIPRFRKGEVIRVDCLDESWKADSAWLMGQEGVVESISSPNDEGTSWLYLVWIDEPDGTRALFIIDEENLASVGALDDGDGNRSALPATSTDELRDQIVLLLFTDTKHRGGSPLARAAQLRDHPAVRSGGRRPSDFRSDRGVRALRVDELR